MICETTTIESYIMKCCHYRYFKINASVIINSYASDSLIIIITINIKSKVSKYLYLNYS